MKKLVVGILVLVLVAAAGFFAPGILTGDLENKTTVLIARDKDHVWAKFKDESKMKEWLKGFKSIETIEEKEGVVGSKFRLKFDNDGQEIEMIETMTAYKEGEHFAFVLENEMMHSEVDVTFIDKGLSTEMIQKEKYRGQNIFWHSMFYWLKSTFVENSKEALEKFKNYAEGD